MEGKYSYKKADQTVPMPGATGLALGLLALDICSVSGDSSSAHRYCTEVVFPLLTFLINNPSMKVTLASAGADLEFLATQHPKIFSCLQELISRRQVELISSLYTRTLWTAFPLTDIERSVELNQRILERLALPTSRLFWAPGGLFGPGVAALSSLFDFAVCKDTTLRYFCESAPRNPIFNLGQVKVVIGANHIAHTVASSITGQNAPVIRATEWPTRESMCVFQRTHLELEMERVSSSDYAFINGCYGQMRWHWYHVGDACNFTTTKSSRSRTDFRFDDQWFKLCCAASGRKLCEGFAFGHIIDLVSALNEFPSTDLPYVTESDSNPSEKQGMGAFMAKQGQRWQNPAELLSRVWRSRKVLRRTEKCLERNLELLDEEGARIRLSDAWSRQLCAESLDSYDSHAAWREVNYCLEQSEAVERICANVTADMLLHAAFSNTVDHASSPAREEVVTAPIDCEIIGGAADVQWRDRGAAGYVCDVRLITEQAAHGIRFRSHNIELQYCPSANEWSPRNVVLASSVLGDIFLPLSNGLLSLGCCSHIVRDNSFCMVAARLSKLDDWITFTVDGGPSGQVCEWRFFLLTCGIEEAVAFANELNGI